MSDKPKAAVLIEGTNRQEYCGYPIVEKITDAEKVAIIDKGIVVTPAHLEQGFKWLGRWDAIAPFRPYQELAIDLIKGKSQKEITALGLGDLRVPTFDPRLVFILLSERTRALWESYRKHKEEWDPRIAFLAAVWETKPYIKPLPAGKWIK